MARYFQRAAVFTDLHMGNKINNLQHNEDCIHFIKWFIDLAHQKNCDICLFLGDYFHNRNNINLVTLNYGLKGLEMLSESFSKTIMIPGNHDLFYRDRRTVSSIAWADNIPNIEILNEITLRDGVLFCPWLLKGEGHKVFENEAKYVFGHFELPNFYMNSMSKMPDSKEVDVHSEQFSKFDNVFTGHFHKRQHSGNIDYIGNAFPHNFGDANDDERGCMILEWDGDGQYFTWPEAPKYRNVNISQLINGNPSHFLSENSAVKMNLDIDISYTEANDLKDSLISEYKLREMSLVDMKSDLMVQSGNSDANVTFQSVDKVVENSIVNLDTEHFDKSLLLEIYQSL